MSLDKAVVIVHWPSGPTYACRAHAIRLLDLGAAMGLHVGLKPYEGERECDNCKNEQEKTDAGKAT